VTFSVKIITENGLNSEFDVVCI